MLEPNLAYPSSSGQEAGIHPEHVAVHHIGHTVLSNVFNYLFNIFAGQRQAHPTQWNKGKDCQIEASYHAYAQKPTQTALET